MFLPKIMDLKVVRYQQQTSYIVTPSIHVSGCEQKNLISLTNKRAECLQPGYLLANFY